MVKVASLSIDFWQIMSEDPHKHEQALMTLASVSLGPHLPLERFYNNGTKKAV